MERPGRQALGWHRARGAVDEYERRSKSRQADLRNDRSRHLINMMIAVLTADALVNGQVTFVDGGVVLQDGSKVLDVLGNVQGRVKLGALAIMHEHALMHECTL